MPCAEPAPITAQAPPPDKAVAAGWEGWGTSLAWFGNALGHNTKMCDVICQLLFGQQGLALNIVRYNIGGANQADVQEYRAGAAVPCFALPGGGYNWDADAGQVRMLLKAAHLGADTFEAFVNSPPYFWTVSGTSRGHKLPLKSNLDKRHIQAFARFCADVVHHFQAVHGITFTSLSPFNEPASPAWCLAVNCKQEACYFSRRRSHKVLRALKEQPGLQGTQLVAFEQFCIKDTLADLTRLPRQLRPAVDRVNTHTYDSSTFFAKAARPLVLLQDNRLMRWRLRRLLQHWGGKPLWVSEFGTGRGAFKLAKHVVKDLATLLPSAFVFWQAVEDTGSGWGLLEAPINHPPACGSSSSSNGGGGGGGGRDQNDGRPVAPGALTAQQQLACCVDAASQHAAAGTNGSSSVTSCPAAPLAQLQQQEAQHQAASQQPPPPVSQQPAQQLSQLPPQQQQTQMLKVVLHPNYYVMQFLVQAVPVGSKLFQVKAFGRYGFAVQLPPLRQAGPQKLLWSLIYINPSRTTEQAIAVDADSWLRLQQNCCVSGRNGVAAVTAGHTAGTSSSVSTSESQQHQEAAAAAVSAGPLQAQSCSLRVSLLEVEALQPVNLEVAAGDVVGSLATTQVIGAPPQQAAPQARVQTVELAAMAAVVGEAEAAGAHGFSGRLPLVAVPPAHMCRIDLVAVAPGGT